MPFTYRSRCTTAVLRDSTVSTGESINEIQTKQIADNIAAFEDQQISYPKVKGDPLPWSFALTTSQVQVTDQISPSITASIPIPQGTNSYTPTPGVTASRQWQISWNAIPITNAEAIQNLGYFYHYIVYKNFPDIDNSAGKSIYPDSPPIPTNAKDVQAFCDIVGLGPNMLPTVDDLCSFINVTTPGKTDSPACVGSFRDTTVWISQEKRPTLAKVAICVMKILEPAIANKAFILGNQIQSK